MDATKIIAGMIFGSLLLFPFLASIYFAYDRGEILLNSDWEKVSSSHVRLSGRAAGVKALFSLGGVRPFTGQRCNQTAM